MEFIHALPGLPHGIGSFALSFWQLSKYVQNPIFPSLLRWEKENSSTLVVSRYGWPPPSEVSCGLGAIQECPLSSLVQQYLSSIGKNHW